MTSQAHAPADPNAPQDPTTPAASTTPAPPAAPGLSFGQPAMTEDHSLTLAAYEAMGVPVIDHAWDLSEYEQAAEVLAHLAETQPAKLPRWHSPKSGALLKHMLNPATLPAAAIKNAEVAESQNNANGEASEKAWNDALPDLAATEQALADLQALAGGPLSSLTQSYLSTLDHGFSMPDELCATIGFTCRVLPSAHALAAHAKAQGRPDDPRRTAALEQSTVMALSNALGLLQHVGPNQPRAKAILIDHLVHTYTPVAKLLPEQSNALIQRTVQHALSQEKDPVLQAALQKMQAAAPK